MTIDLSDYSKSLSLVFVWTDEQKIDRKWSQRLTAVVLEEWGEKIRRNGGRSGLKQKNWNIKNNTMMGSKILMEDEPRGNKMGGEWAFFKEEMKKQGSTLAVWKQSI